MLHAQDPAVWALLLDGNFGLEKESLRITSEGHFAHTPHPFPEDERIVRDFCENRTEINTPVLTSAHEAVKILSDRYGRYKMTFSNALLQADFAVSRERDFTVYKNQLYVDLAERAAAFGWILTAVTAASPLMDSSFVEKGRFGEDEFNGRVQEVLSFEEAKFLDPEKRCAWQIRKQFAGGFVQKGLALAKRQQEEVVDV